MTKKLICINCPLGCRLKVDDSNLSDIKVTDNKCNRGKNYAINEVTAPKRMVTGSVPVEGGDRSRVSVKTVEPIPKERIFDCLREMKKVHAVAPIKIGDVVCANVCNTDVDVVATCNVNKI